VLAWAPGARERGRCRRRWVTPGLAGVAHPLLDNVRQFMGDHLLPRRRAGRIFACAEHWIRSGGAGTCANLSRRMRGPIVVVNPHIREIRPAPRWGQVCAPTRPVPARRAKLPIALRSQLALDHNGQHAYHHCWIASDVASEGIRMFAPRSVSPATRSMRPHPAPPVLRTRRRGRVWPTSRSYCASLPAVNRRLCSSIGRTAG
jgi:hypothetical protein